MKDLLLRKLGVGVFAAAAGLTACGTAPPAEPAHPSPSTSAVPAPTAAPTEAPAAEAPVPVPVDADDPTWGSPNAPVTIVEAGDFQCPFCERARATLEDVKDAYGPEKLRVVWKNQPLPFHNDAQPAARAAQAIFALDGSEAFWAAHHALYNRQDTLADATSQLLDRARAAHPDLVPALGLADKKLDRDKALFVSLKAFGTPVFFINGVRVAGAQPFEAFKEVIDAQLQKASDLLGKGVAPAKVYAELTRAQLEPEATKPNRLDFSGPRETNIFRLPVGKSPVRGPADAPLTMVLLTDLACQSCRLWENNLADVMAAHKDKVRLVVKLARAVKSGDGGLHVALEARAKKGDAGFWKVFDALRAESAVDDGALERAATAAGLPAKSALAAAHDKKHKALIDADEELLDEAGTSWTPGIYLNGQVSSAYSTTTLSKAVDDAIAAAEATIAAGTPRAKLYDKLLEGAKPPVEPDKKAAPAAPKDAPGHGPAGSKVVIQLFGNFESAPTERLFDTVEEIEKDFPGKVRVVFRHLPLSVQPGSQLAAEAANEAFAQKGDEGFLTMARLLFAGRPRLDGLERPALLRDGAQVGLDAGKLATALDQHTHKAEIAAEVATAKQAGIRAPTMFVNDMLLSGPLPRVRRIIRKILAAK